MNKGVFLPGTRDGFQFLDVRGIDWGTVLLAPTEQLGRVWISREAGLNTVDERGQPLRRSDFPDLGGGTIFAMSERAREVLAPLLGGAVELRPLSAGGETYFAVVGIVRVGCLDRGASEIVWWEEGDGEGAMMVRRYVFRPEALGRYHIFALPEFRRSPVYVDEVFVSAAEEAGLQGVVFRRVWSEG